MHTMSTHTVALDEEAYELLRRAKKTEESFSGTVKRLARPHRPLASFAGMWKDMTTKDREALERVYSSQRDADRRRAELIRKMWE